MISRRSPLAIIYTALTFGIVIAPYCFFGVLMDVVQPLRLVMTLMLFACTAILAFQLTGWSTCGGRWGPIFPLVLSCTEMAFLSVGGSFMAETSLVWFYVLQAIGLGSAVALLPIVFFKPTRVERAVASLLSASRKSRLPIRPAAYGFLIFLLAFASVQVFVFYRFNHPKY